MFRLLLLVVMLTGCAPLVSVNMEAQDTIRINTTNARNLSQNDNEVQGSERVQAKNKTGIKANADVASHTSKTEVFGSDVSGSEK